MQAAMPACDEIGIHIQILLGSGDSRICLKGLLMGLGGDKQA